MSPIEVALAVITAMGILLNIVERARSNRSKLDFEEEKLKLKQNIENQTTQLSATQLAITTVQSTNADLRADISAIKAENTNLRTDRSSLLDALGEMKSLVLTLKEEKAQALLQVEGFSSQVSALSKSVTDGEVERKVLELTVAHLKGALEEQRANHDREITRYGDAMGKRVHDLEVSLLEANAKIEGLSRDVREKDTLILDLRKRLGFDSEDKTQAVA